MPLDEAFVNSIPEDIRKEPSFAEIQKGDNVSLVKSLIDSQKTLGRAIILPDEKDPDDKKVEKLNQVFDKLGRPKTHKEYDFSDVVKEDSGVQAEHLEKFQDVFHKAGLSNTQAKAVVAAYLEHVASSQLTIDSAKEALGDQYDSITGSAKKALLFAGEVGEEALNFFEETKLGNDPRVLRLLDKFGSLVKEDVAPRLPSRSGGMDKESAQSRVAEIMNDRKGPYWNKDLAGHKEAVAEVLKLNEIIHGVKVETTIGERR